MGQIIITDKMAEVLEGITDSKYKGKKNLVLFDIDKTIGYGFDEMAAIQDFELVEPEVVDVIHTVQKQENTHCCALTARNIQCHEGTKAQLSPHKIDFSISTPFVDKYLPEKAKIGHKEGIVYTYKHPKTEIIQAVLKGNNISFDTIFSIEDNMENAIDMGVDLYPQQVVSFWYTRFEDERAKRQEEAQKRLIAARVKKMKMEVEPMFSEYSRLEPSNNNNN